MPDRDVSVITVCNHRIEFPLPSSVQHMYNVGVLST